MGKEDNGWIAGLGIAAGMLILWLTYDRSKKQQELEYIQRRNQRLQQDKDILLDVNSTLQESVEEHRKNLHDLRAMINGSDHIEEGVKKKLNSLIDTYRDIDIKVSNELTAAMALIDAKQPTKAAFSLAKIVENLLKEKYQEDEGFKRFLGRRRVNFHEYLEYAKDDKLIEKEEFHFAKGLKEIRNEEGHELDVTKTDSFLHTAFFASIGLILKLGIAVRKNESVLT